MSRVSPERMKITKAHEESERTQRVSLCQCILLCCCLLLSILSQFLTLKQIHDLTRKKSNYSMLRETLSRFDCEADVSMTESFIFILTCYWHVSMFAGMDPRWGSQGARAPLSPIFFFFLYIVITYFFYVIGTFKKTKILSVLSPLISLI